MITGPFGALLGISFGILLARRWRLSYALFSAWGGVVGILAMYLAGHLESWVRARFPERGPASAMLAQVGADVVGGAVLGGLFALALDTDAAASLAAGASLLLAYSFVATRLLWGDLVEDLVGLVSGQAGRARVPDYSMEQSLAAQGRIDEAVRAYERACRERPEEPRPILLAAEMLRAAGRFREAVVWYRRALALPRVDARRAGILTRYVWELCAVALDDPAEAEADLHALVDRFPAEPVAEWARERLATMPRGSGRA